MVRKILCYKLIALVFSVFIASSASADVGDYGVFQFLKNLRNAPNANNPVNKALIRKTSLNNGTPVIPFSRNPYGYEDGFRPRAYGVWQTVTLDGQHTGARCGDGSYYKFKISRSATSSNVVIFLEGGGACWNHELCSKGALSNAGIISTFTDRVNVDANTKLLPVHAMSVVTLNALSAHPDYRQKYSGWTKVYLPYCTQDLQIGNVEKIYYPEKQDGQAQATKNPIRVKHNGLKIQGAVLTWLKDNLERPGQILLTGQSAGGYGSELLYHAYRTALAPQKGYMLNDSGPIVQAPAGGSVEEYPSGPALRKLMNSWNTDNYFAWLEEQSVKSKQRFDSRDMGTLSDFLSSHWYKDRFMLATLRIDETIQWFGYENFAEEITGRKDISPEEIRRCRFKDMDNKRSQLSKIANYGYFIPGYRKFMSSHVLTLPVCINYGKNEDDGNNIISAIRNLMSGTGRVMESWEGDYSLLLDEERQNFDDNPICGL